MNVPKQAVLVIQLSIKQKALPSEVSWCAGVDFSTAAPEQIAPQGKNALLFLQDDCNDALMGQLARDGVFLLELGLEIRTIVNSQMDQLS